jgi:hypothetical protein
MRAVELEKRIHALESAQIPADMSRFLIWSSRPDDPDYVDGPALVDDAATCRSYEVADNAELVALINRLSLDGIRWPLANRPVSFSKSMHGRKR